MNFFQLAGVLSVVITVITITPYVMDILAGRTKPQSVAALVFLTLNVISFSGQWQEGANFSLYWSGTMVGITACIFLLSLSYGMGGSSKFDYFTLASTVCILGAWWFTESGVVAICLTVSVNFIAKLLVIHKIWHHPNTEFLPTWVGACVSSVFAVIAVRKWDFVLMLPPLNSTVTVAMISYTIVHRRKLEVLI